MPVPGVLCLFGLHAEAGRLGVGLDAAMDAIFGRVSGS
jgi:hypothetical protein